MGLSIPRRNRQVDTVFGNGLRRHTHGGRILEGKELSMDRKPDFERIRMVAAHHELDQVPLCEVLIEYPIQSSFLGREVTSDNLESQLEFWIKAGYDFIPLTVGMMTPGKVTTESMISKVIKDVMLKDSPDAEKEEAWSLERTSFINNREKGLTWQL